MTSEITSPTDLSAYDRTGTYNAHIISVLFSCNSSTLNKFQLNTSPTDLSVYDRAGLLEFLDSGRVQRSGRHEGRQIVLEEFITRGFAGKEVQNDICLFVLTKKHLLILPILVWTQKA